MPDPRPVPLFLSTDSAERKMMPVASGVIAYFPRALKLVAFQSHLGNEKHSPGQSLHWAKEKSADEPDAEIRHMIDHYQGLPPDPGLAERLGSLAHKTAKAWRALADLEREAEKIEAEYRAAEFTKFTPDRMDVWIGEAVAQDSVIAPSSKCRTPDCVETRATGSYWCAAACRNAAGNQIDFK